MTHDSSPLDPLDPAEGVDARRASVGAGPEEPMVEVDDLTLAYGDNVVLERLSFHGIGRETSCSSPRC